MKLSPLGAVAALGLLLSGVAAGQPAATKARVTGWLDWRGPEQNGTCPETGLPDTVAVGGPSELWHVDISGGGTPVIGGGKLYAIGYEGEGPDLQEVLLCADANTGKMLWQKRFNDFLSDTSYNRYAIGSPTIDPETGNVYVLTSAGEFACYTADGTELWKHSLMEELGKLTFPNARTGGPVIDDDLVIVRGITSNWGAEGPAADRFYAYDKKTGGLVWSSTPGDRPKDNSFARPYFSWRNGKRVFYSGTGDGSVVCVDVRTGQPLWRFPVSAGGMNSSVVLYKNLAVAIHADENLDSSEIGRQVAVKVDAEGKAPEMGATSPTPVLDRSAEAWRNNLEAISSSPVLVGNRIYQVNKTGQLCCVDADSGKVLWRHKLGPDELHASPLYADGKLYVPIQNGTFYILKPGETDATELCKVQLDGRCQGAPSVWNGKVYVFTTQRLYCFGKKAGGFRTGPSRTPNAERPMATPGKPVALQVIPAEVILQPGQKAKFTIRGIDANGFPTGNYNPATAKWAKYIPPTARVRAEMGAEVNPQGEMVADTAQKPSAGAWEVTVEGLKGYVRGRVLPSPPLKQDFEAVELTVPHETEQGVKFQYPPLPWIGARFKWEVRDLDGNKVLAKTLDNIFFQRSTAFIGHPELKNYTVEADVMSDGNRRTMSDVGLIDQRYLVTLLGNAQQLEISSNKERVRASVPFQWVPKTWYHLKTRVDAAADGSGMVRAKAWKKGETEPEKWTIEVPHKHAHQVGAPGFYGFAPQSMFRVYIDNLSVTPNK